MKKIITLTIFCIFTSFAQAQQIYKSVYLTDMSTWDRYKEQWNTLNTFHPDNLTLTIGNGYISIDAENDVFLTILKKTKETSDKQSSSIEYIAVDDDGVECTVVVLYMKSTEKYCLNVFYFNNSPFIMLRYFFK